MTKDPQAEEMLKISKEDFTAIIERVMVAGVPLMVFKPQALRVAGEKVESDLKTGAAFRLTTVKRRRGEALVKLLKAAETFRDASMEYKLTLDIVDPSEGKPVN